jgi:hypothetical protein
MNMQRASNGSLQRAALPDPSAILGNPFITKEKNAPQRSVLLTSSINSMTAAVR